MVKSSWVDISVPIKSDMVHWPGDPSVSIRRVQDLEAGDSHTLSMLSLGSHTGTHVDAPAHFLKGGNTVDHIAADVLVGKAMVLEIKDNQSIKPSELERFNIKRGERILFKTSNSSLWESDKFAEEFVFISPEGAELLAKRSIRLVGVDYLSVGAFKGGGSVQHKALLKAGVCIVEGLNLSKVAAGRYDFICMPLRLEHGDGAPARAFIRPAR